MSPFHWFTILSLLGVVLINIILGITLKKSLSKMAAMMISMFTGMNVGITAGLVVGSVYQGNLFFSTSLSLAIGLFIGISFGITMGILQGIEALMSGIMGGMMGAMLSEMILLNQSVLLTKILLTLSVCSIVLFFILRTGQNDKIINKKWFLRPIGFLFILVIYLGFGSSLDYSYSGNNLSMKEDTLNNTRDPAEKITITIDEQSFTYNPSMLKIKDGQKVSLVLVNNDEIEHDLQIASIPIQRNSENSHHSGHNSNADIHLHAEANNESQLSFTPLAKGTYEFYCTLPGHKENGMVGQLIVY
ncbi:MAG TPA: plastocyanin/azurin family copper-binding protein [Bacillus sp. (in: firmicutes)]|uniref:plastocyanin/azurin family copper-binding protein n=1 Tax=Bacillus litorisediminis TaxID=2922713 RepID=UPI001FAF67EF|nr:plastocyanin/azurin family copper-binding protein [Bacillus litorisediminis]HWO76008.1 plastocyanin/azurin family copper-binding protein [Bacillus sp. (in: firmicutes)]